MPFYDEEYREALAKRKGFDSYKEYADYKLAKRKEKLKEIGKRIEDERERTKRELEEELEREKRYTPILERTPEERLKYFQEHRVCQSLQKIVSEVEDENSIFKDIKFLEKFTGCKIKRKK